jgi:hypothetical protein
MPAPNLSGVGDGLNTSGYFFNLSTPLQTDYGVVRVDHTFTDKIQFNGSYTYFRSISTGSNDVGILNGKPASFIQSPQRGTVMSGSVTWQAAPTFLVTSRFGFVRDNNAAQATSPAKAAGLLRRDRARRPVRWGC